MICLGVNIDHVATLRQVRRSVEPDPVWAAAICELSGASNITVHLREDRRHIQTRDVELLRASVRSKLNLEMAHVSSIVDFALRVKPDQVTLVPEKRKEFTTEGGLHIGSRETSLKKTIKILKRSGIRPGVFIDAEKDEVERSRDLGVDFVEFHTGRFADAPDALKQERELEKLCRAAEWAHQLDLEVHAGHGLHYVNVHLIKRMPHLMEVNIGHAIIARAVLVGLERAVREMVLLVQSSDR